MYKRVVAALNAAATLYVPIRKTSFFKYWWDQELDLLKKDSIDSHKQWIEAKRPLNGSIYDKKRKSKAAYKLCIKKNQEAERSNCSNSLHDALMSKHNTVFWKIWNSKFGSKKSLPSVINGSHDDEVIACNFADYFSKICSVNSMEKNAKFFHSFSSRLINYSGDMIDSKLGIDVFMIDNIVTNLHVGKATDLDNLSAEHLKYSHPVLFSILNKLFNLMLKTNHVPSEFGIGLTIPIPKIETNTKSLTTDDFRGITISPIVSKVFESCLLKMLNDYLSTSDLQFGFKKKSGCSHAIYTVRSTVDYFTTNNSTVNLCAIDISKAFDRVNNYALLLKLMDRNIPKNLLLILEYWYKNIYITVRWKTSFSHSVKLTAGVRQGGILSSYLFAIFVDSVLVRLRHSSLGCHINTMCYNAIMYADDLLLMAISRNDLQLLLNICVEEFDMLDLCINIKKSMCIRIGKRHTDDIIPISIINQCLEWKQEIRYLGVYIVSANTFKLNLQIPRQKFFRALNGIFAKIGTKAAPFVVLSLVNSYCLPVLLYATETLVLNAKMRNIVENAVNTVFAKLFSSFDKVVIQNCQFYCKFLPVIYSMDIRTFEFCKELSNHSNDSLRLLFLRTDTKLFEKLQMKYGVNSMTNVNQLKSVLWKHFENCLKLIDD
jgi:hypothetical protein